MREKKIFYVISIILILCMLPVSVFADVPYITWTQGPGNYIVDTQSAYLPKNIIKLNLNKPEDLFVDEDNVLYVCDTGNKRIVILKPDGKIEEIKGDPLIKPTGIYIIEDEIYIADYDAQKILIYNKNGKLLREIGRPKEVIFGSDTKFLPLKLSVDARRNIYIVSEGSTSGIMQLNNQGDFLGYFGANQTNTSLKVMLQKAIFSEEQLAKMFKNAPASITNLAIDAQGLIYTVTRGIYDGGIKKLNIAGKNLFPEQMFADITNIDIDVDSYGNTFVLTSDGFVFEYDSFGNFLFAFGGKDIEMKRVGLVENPVAIDIANNGELLVLDKEKGIVQVYTTTEFAKEVHKGISLYKDGLYQQSEQNWMNIQKMNSAFILSYEALAKSNFKNEEYATALDYYKIAENKLGYSQTYWIYRNLWLQKYLGILIVVVVLFLIVWSILKRLDKKKGLFNGVRSVRDNFYDIDIVSKVMFMKVVMKKPMDAYYDLKFKNKVSMLSATLLYVWLYILQITNIFVVGYLFNNRNMQTTNLLNEAFTIFAPIFFWIVCNYLVSTITDGEGKLRDIYCGTIYAIAPYLILALPLQILTNVLTINEAFVYDFGMLFIYAWCFILLFIMVKEVHDYSFKQTVKNILVTIFTIVLMLLVIFIMYMLFKQLFNFFEGIIQEVQIRV